MKTLNPHFIDGAMCGLRAVTERETLNRRPTIETIGLFATRKAVCILGFELDGEDFNVATFSSLQRRPGANDDEGLEIGAYMPCFKTGMRLFRWRICKLSGETMFQGVMWPSPRMKRGDDFWVAFGRLDYPADREPSIKTW